MEGMLAFELGGASGENAMAVISEGLQSTKRHRWTAKLVRSDGAVRSMAIQEFSLTQIVVNVSAQKREQDILTLCYLR